MPTSHNTPNSTPAVTQHQNRFITKPTGAFWSPYATPPPDHNDTAEVQSKPIIRPRFASKNPPYPTYSYVHPFATDNSAFGEAMKCPECSHVYTTPLLFPCCGIKVCSTCVKKWVNGVELCMPCLRTVHARELIVDEGLKVVLDDLHVYCARKRNGCQWVGPRKYLYVHVAEECAFATDPARQAAHPDSLNYLAALTDPSRSMAITHDTFPTVSPTLGRPFAPRSESQPKIGTNIPFALRPLNVGGQSSNGQLTIPVRNLSTDRSLSMPKKAKPTVFVAGGRVPERRAVPRREDISTMDTNVSNAADTGGEFADYGSDVSDEKWDGEETLGREPSAPPPIHGSSSGIEQTRLPGPSTDAGSLMCDASVKDAWVDSDGGSDRDSDVTDVNSLCWEKNGEGWTPSTRSEMWDEVYGHSQSRSEGVESRKS